MEKWWCSGSTVLCKYFQDVNGTFSDILLREIVWPLDYVNNEMRTSQYLFARKIMEKIIVLRLKYKSSVVEMNKFEIRTTMTDKIANFGGTFGIWAELTGCSLLGMINLLIISCKLFFRSRH